jgi:BASS family bile acid:Na+ symporter
LVATLLAPLTLPPLALLLLDLDLQIGIGVFMGRLALIMLGAFLIAAAIRKLTGPARLAAHAEQIDGFIVVVMLVFAVAIMDGVTATLIERPGIVALWALAAFIANPGLQALGIAAFGWLGRKGALTVGLVSGNCNMGLLLAALPATSDFDTLLYFAVAQLPIFVLPALLLPVYRRLLAA